MQTRRLSAILAATLVLALMLGMMKSTVAGCLTDADLSQELSLADDGSGDRTGDSACCILTAAIPLIAIDRPVSPGVETLCVYFASLSLPPDTPPPIHA